MNMLVEGGVTNQTRDMVRRWIAAKAAFTKFEERMKLAKSELEIATNELGRWICPDDRKTGEVFNIWYGSGLLQAHLASSMDDTYLVSWRKLPDGKQLAEEGS